MDPNYGSPKWVTFTDAMDDAMEGGKLFPITRRMSVGTLPYISTSASSSVSTTSGSGVGAIRDRNPLDFSQSFGFGDEMKGRNQPEKISGDFGCGGAGSGGSFHFEEDQNTVYRKISAESNLSSSSGSFSNCDQPPSGAAVARKISAPSTIYYDSNLSSSSGSFSNSFDGAGNSNKYSVFCKLEKTNGGKGWGRKVLGSSPMGWSDEILGSSVDSDDESEMAQASRPDRLKIEEEPWHSGAALAGRKTWEKSPSRSFVRNFP